MEQRTITNTNSEWRISRTLTKSINECEFCNPVGVVCRTHAAASRKERDIIMRRQYGKGYDGN